MAVVLAQSFLFANMTDIENLIDSLEVMSLVTWLPDLANNVIDERGCGIKNQTKTLMGICL